ncbi:MAG: hypothetical protein JWQ66_2947 [Mucilaginibacter sp.]|nr:hypothetical protein [Mucilaginibacter sp.]
MNDQITGSIFLFVVFFAMAGILAFKWNDIIEFFKGKPKPEMPIYESAAAKRYRFYKALFAKAYEESDYETMELANEKLKQIERSTGVIKDNDYCIIDRIHLIKGIPLNKAKSIQKVNQ